MTKTIYAIYDTLSAMSDFFKTLTAWFGFGPMVVLMGLLFFFKLFQSFFPAGRMINMIFSFSALTALWLTWNQNYYHDFRILEIIRIYGFLCLPIVSLIITYFFLRLTGRKIYRKLRLRKYSIQRTLEIYELIDETALNVKEKIKNGDPAQASQALDFLKDTLEKLKNAKN